MRSAASVVIIGAGAAGASTAYHLAQMQQRDVLLLDQSRIASGASSVSNNIVERQFVEELDILLRVKSFEILQPFFDRRAVPFRRIGYLRLTGEEREIAGYKDSVRIQKRLGVPDSRVVWPEDLLKMFPFMNPQGLAGGLYGPSDGITDGARLTRAFAGEAKKGGVRVLEGTKVSDLKVSGGNVMVKTNRGEITCERVVNATGPWAGRLAKTLGVWLPVRPVRRQMAVFDAPVKNAGSLTNCVDMSTRFYVHGSGHGRTIFSGLTTNIEADPDRYARGADRSFLRDLAEAMRFRVPGLAASRLKGSRAGVLDVTPDSRPIIGVHPEMPQLVSCIMGGFGIQLSPVIGRLVAEIIVDGKTTTIRSTEKLKIERLRG